VLMPLIFPKMNEQVKGLGARSLRGRGVNYANSKTLIYGSNYFCTKYKLKYTI